MISSRTSLPCFISVVRPLFLAFSARLPFRPHGARWRVLLKADWGMEGGSQEEDVDVQSYVSRAAENEETIYNLAGLVHRLLEIDGHLHQNIPTSPTNPHFPIIDHPRTLIMAPIAIHTINLDTKTYQSDMSETPSPDGPLLAVPSSKKSSTISTTWLKLNSTAPIHVEVKEFPDSPAFHDEPFSGAKKLRHLIENTEELVVCPGVYDGLSARTAMELGFKSLYMVRRSVPFLVIDQMTMVSWQLRYMEPLSLTRRPVTRHRPVLAQLLLVLASRTWPLPSLPT